MLVILHVVDLWRPYFLGQRFQIKTDHRGYFDWILQAVQECPDQWQVLDVSTDLHKNHPNPEKLQIPDVTLFEKLFIKDRLPIHSLQLKRTPGPF